MFSKWRKIGGERVGPLKLKFLKKLGISVVIFQTDNNSYIEHLKISKNATPSHTYSTVYCFQIKEL